MEYQRAIELLEKRKTLMSSLMKQNESQADSCGYSPHGRSMYMISIIQLAHAEDEFREMCKAIDILKVAVSKM